MTKHYRLPALILFFVLSAWPAGADEENRFRLKVNAEGLRSMNGVVIFSLYNRDGTIPDRHLNQYFMSKASPISGSQSSVIFEGLEKGTYAVSIVHDEDMDGKLDKGFLLPLEGVGISNYQTIGLGNKPNFRGASFPLESDLTVRVKLIYM